MSNEQSYRSVVEAYESPTELVEWLNMAMRSNATPHRLRVSAGALLKRLSLVEQDISRAKISAMQEDLRRAATTSNPEGDLAPALPMGDVETPAQARAEAML